MRFEGINTLLVTERFKEEKMIILFLKKKNSKFHFCTNWAWEPLSWDNKFQWCNTDSPWWVTENNNEVHTSFLVNSVLLCPAAPVLQTPQSDLFLVFGTSGPIAPVCWRFVPRLTPWPWPWGNRSAAARRRPSWSYETDWETRMSSNRWQQTETETSEKDCNVICNIDQNTGVAFK